MNKPQPIGRASQTAQPSGPAPRKLRAGRPIGLKGEDVPPFSGNAAPAPKIEGQPSKPALARPSRSDGPSRIALRHLARATEETSALLQAQISSDDTDKADGEALGHSPASVASRVISPRGKSRRPGKVRVARRGNMRGGRSILTQSALRKRTGPVLARDGRARRTVRSGAGSSMRATQWVVRTMARSMMAAKAAVMATVSAAAGLPLLVVGAIVMLMISLLMWLIPTVAVGGQSTCQSSVAEVPEQAKPWVERAAQSSGLGADFIAALMRRESGFNPEAYADDSNGGTWGLLQLNRSVWRGVHPEGADQTPPQGITDPNIHAQYGGIYLKNRLEGVRQLKASHPDAQFARLSDLEALVIAHNAGEGNLMKYPDIPNVTKEYLDEVRPAINAGGSCSATAGATIGALSPPLVVDGTSIDIDASGVPMASINSYSVGQCTWWAATRRQQIGKPADPYMGHGYMWAASAERHGYPIGGTIQLGDVMSFERGVLGASGEYGHVAIVEEIHEDGSILISESGGGQRRAWTRLLTREQAENPGITYIH